MIMQLYIIVGQVYSAGSLQAMFRSEAISDPARIYMH